MLAPNESFCVSSLAALREVTHLKTSMTKTQAETVLGSFVARGWLLKSQCVLSLPVIIPWYMLIISYRKGRYSLSTRTILELQQYLRSTYPDEVIDCTICMEVRHRSLPLPSPSHLISPQMVTSGYSCPTQACKSRLHAHCYKNYRKIQSSCPTCNTDWGEDDDTSHIGRVGESAFREGQEKGRRVRRNSTEEAEDDEEEEEEYQEEEEQPSQQQPSQVKVKKEKTAKGKKKVVKSDDEDADEQEDESPPPRTQGKRKARR